MAVTSFLKSSGVAALAAGLAMIALPSAAFAQDEGEGRGDGGRFQERAELHAGNEGGGGGNRGGGWAQRTQEAPQVMQQIAPQVEIRQQAAAEQRGWAGRAGGNEAANGAGNERSNRSDNGGGWAQRSQPSAPPVVIQDAPRPERNWTGRGSNDAGGGEGWRSRTPQVNAPPVAQAPAWRSTPQVQRSEPPRGSWGAQVQNAPPPRSNSGNWSGNWSSGERNRSYVDPGRNSTQNRSWSERNRNDNDRRDSWQGNNNSWQNNNRYQGNRQSYSGNYRQWDNDWRRDNRYNWYSYRNQNRDIFRWGSYYAPYRNYSYRRISIGFYLDSLFFSSRYWINDPWQYRLPEAYGPYRWVRYYDDALLVDVYSGEVVDVIRDFFW